jgi:hypothetical protein
MPTDETPVGIHHEIRTDPEGKAVLARWSAAPAGRARLAHTASVLERARHPGVVELRSFRDEDERAELIVAWVASATAADLPHLPVRELAGLVAAVADTVADLHGIGIVHGALRAEHVLVAGDGRPVLCGFGDARVAGPGGDPPRPSTDVAALGALIDALLGATDPPDATPTRRGTRRGRGGRNRDTAHLRRGLRTLAEHAAAEDPSCRPSARALAAAITALVPDATLPGGSAPATDTPGAGPGGRRGAPGERARTGGADGRRGPRDDGRHGTDGALDGDPGGGRDDEPDDEGPGDPGGDGLDRLRATMSEPPARRAPAWARAAAVGAVVVVAATGGLIALRPGPPERSEEGHALAAASPVVVDDPGPGSAPTGTVGRPSGPGGGPTGTAPGTAPGTTVAEDRVAGGTEGGTPTGSSSPDDRAPVVEVGGRRYEVGEPGDVVAVGDWHCDGSPVAAVLRPGTGDVFVFDGWAAPGGTLDATARTRLPGARDLTAGPAPPGACRPLVAVLADGTTRPIEPAEPAP